jgi:23S rRNA (uracil1939-C5)-methyltransferase
VAHPCCRHFGPCGGCDWQNLPYAEQLSRKRDQLERLLSASLGRRAPRVDPVIGMPVDRSGWPWEFRQKAAFVFGEGEDRSTVIGHYAARSQAVVPIVECPVHAARANRIAFALHAQLARAHVTAAGPSLRGVLRHLIVRTTRDGREAVAMLVVTRNDKSLRRPVRAFLGTEDAPDGFYLNIHDRPGPYMIGRETMRLSGRSHVRETVAGVSYLVSPTAFFQTNVAAAEQLVALVLEAAASAPALRVLDLYSGTGLFTLPLAARGHDVIAIEENAQAVRDAEDNVRLNRLPAGKVVLIASRVEDALRRIGHTDADLVILDPPRQGCPPALLEFVFRRLQPPRAVYVSCNADTLAAELPLVVDAGYAIERVQPVDMFPHTTHIETVLIVSRSSRRGRRESDSAPPASARPRSRRR